MQTNAPRTWETARRDPSSPLWAYSPHISRPTEDSNIRLYSTARIGEDRDRQNSASSWLLPGSLIKKGK
jgi:hypothetical protein